MTANESRYRAFLDTRARDGLRRALLPVAARGARMIGAEGRSYLNFSSNDYLGLRFHSALIRRAAEWAEAYGSGSGASRLVTGNLDLFAPIEAKVARLKGTAAALVMASGFQANAAVLQALLDRSVLVRDCSGWPRLENCLRVTVGSADENDSHRPPGVRSRTEISSGAFAARGTNRIAGSCQATVKSADCAQPSTQPDTDDVDAADDSFTITPSPVTCPRM